MAKYLWDLDLENIPLGWEETFRDALRICPDGEITPISYSSYHGEKLERYLYHPVKFRDRLIELFNADKAKAVNLMESNTISDSFLNQLFKIDVRLFNILDAWLTPDDEIEGEMLDPREMEQKLLDYRVYFQCEDEELVEIYNEKIREYIPLRIFSLSGRRL
ncbi:hypothetical protein ACTID9_00800 [Brevibacillus fluminis]|uniref:hypothetical protein n=1 Tax=Brevibacillus fluminis TaxID=511487 RepID=UPI003F8AD850